MGLRLPLFPYSTWRGAQSRIAKGQSKPNDEAIAPLKDFESYLSRDDVRRIAVNVIPHPVHGTEVWFRPRAIDTDELNRPELNNLLKIVGSHGTIIVPDMSHIGAKSRNRERLSDDTKFMIERIMAENIEIIPLKLILATINESKLTVKLRKIIKKGEPDPSIFALLPALAMEANFNLKRVLGGALNTGYDRAAKMRDTQTRRTVL